MPIWQFLLIVWGGVSGIATVCRSFPPALYFFQQITSNKQNARRREPDRTSDDSFVVKGLRYAIARLSRPLMFAIVSLGAIGSGVAVFYFTEEKPPLAPLSSGILPMKAGDYQRIYLADPHRGALAVMSSNKLDDLTSIPIGGHGKFPGGATPYSLLELRRGRTHLVFVIDTQNNLVRIVDVAEENAEVLPGLPVPAEPRSMAITPDKRKLFVSVEQPIPSGGGVFVFDIHSDNPSEFRKITKITAVNCPEGMALSPRGDRLYVATQCGPSTDSVFIIDTATNKVVGSIPGLAVGTGVAVDATGTKLFVTQGNAPCSGPEASASVSPLSVVDLRSRKIDYSVCLHRSVGALALSRDPEAKYLIVANGNMLSVFDTEKMGVTRRPIIDIPLESTVEAIGVSQDNSVYAYIPESGRVYTFSLTASAAK
jgi:YVTN family beta-propeller protein